MPRTTARILALLVAAPALLGIFADPAAAIASNDDFADAIDAVPPYSHSQDTSGASSELLEPTPSCVAATGSTVWYRLTVTESTDIDISTFGSKFDTILAAYRGTSLDGLTEVACNDDYEQTGSLQARASFVAVPGETYQVQAGGYLGATGRLDISIAGSEALLGDAFAESIPVPSLPFTTAVNLNGATREANEPLGWCGGNDHTIWFSLTPASDMSIRVDTLAGDLDTVLSVYKGTALGDLELVTCNDDTADGPQAKSAFRALSGTTYYIQLDSFHQFGGSTVLTVQSVAPPANDGFAAAAPISMPGKAGASTEGAGIEPGEPQDCNQIDATIWFRWTASEPGAVLANVFGSDFFATVNVYSGTSLADLVVVACDAYGETSFPALPGTTYFFQVGGYGPGDTGNASLRLTNGIHLGVSGVLAGAAVTVGGDPHYRTGYAAAGAPFVFGGAFVDHDDEEGGYVAACAFVVVGTCESVGLPPTSG